MNFHIYLSKEVKILVTRFERRVKRRNITTTLYDELEMYWIANEEMLKQSAQRSPIAAPIRSV